MGALRGISRAAAFLAVASVLGACGSQPDKPRPHREGRPVVVLGTWTFVEQDVLGELYSQALRAKGFRVKRKRNIGTSDIIDEAIAARSIDLYPEYIGIILTAIAGDSSRQRTAAQAYRKAARFERGRGLELLEATPFEDRDALAVKPAFAAAHHLRTVGDLRRLGARATVGAPPEFRARLTGLVGMRRAYGVTRIRFRPLLVPDQYAALDAGRVQVIDVSTTDPQLLRPGAYQLLADPKGIFGLEHVAPVVRRTVLEAQGPQFARTLNSVSRLLTTPVMRQLNAAVVFGKRSPAAVAREFLSRHGLL